MEEKKSIFSLLWHQITTTFALSIIVISITGWALGDAQMEHAGLFRLGSAGLAFQSIAQVFALSIVFSVIVTLLSGDIFFKRIMLLWRVVLTLFLCMVTGVAFALIFSWIPAGMWEAWAAFLGSFILSFLIAFFAAWIKTKLEDRRYEKQLSDYKMRQKQEESK